MWSRWRRFVLKVGSIEEVCKIEKDIAKEFTDEYDNYIAIYKQFGIALRITPCYYYNGKYHTDHRMTGCFLAFRIQCFPINLTFKQAVKEQKYKEFFSHKMLQIKKGLDYYKVRKYSICDRQLKGFLDKHIKRAKKYKQTQINPVQCLQERLADVIVSCIYIYRYRNEVKKTYHGFDLGWLLLILATILAGLSSYMHLKRLYTQW